MTEDQSGTSRGFEYVVFSLPALCFGGLAVASISLPAWSVVGALVAAVVGVVSAVALANASRRLPPWVQTAGVAAAIFVSGNSGADTAGQGASRNTRAGHPPGTWFGF
jgi:hypothetical protein